MAAKKDQYIGIKVTAIEKEILQKKAEVLGMTLSDFMLLAAHTFSYENKERGINV